MTRISKTFVAIAVLALLPAVSSRSAFAATHYYVVANNNTSPTNSVSVFQVSPHDHAAKLLALPH